MIAVLLVEDHPLFLTGVASVLEQQEDIRLVGTAVTADDALRTIVGDAPDVLVTDIRIEGSTNGVELARIVRERYPSIRILVLTNYSQEPYIKAMMEIGVEGYLLKDSSPREVVESIRMVAEGRTVFAGRVTQVLVSGYLDPSERAGGQERIIEREADVLRTLLVGGSNADIAKSLNVSVPAVQFHLSKIYEKLDARNRTEAIVNAARLGLIVIDE